MPTSIDHRLLQHLPDYQRCSALVQYCCIASCVALLLLALYQSVKLIPINLIIMTTIILLEFEPLTETGLLLITCHLPYHLTTSMVAPLPSGTFPPLGVQY